MSVRYCQFCPVSKAAEILGERWTFLILRELLLGSTRFGDLQRGLARLSPTLLTRRLGQLQDHGLVVRKVNPRHRRAEYHLTAAGRELLPVVVGLGKWGMRWARGQMSDDELDVQMLALDLARRIDRGQLPGGRTVVQLTFPELRRFAHWWIVLDPQTPAELCVSNPGRDVDVTIRSELRAMAEYWAGDTDLRTARAAGRMEITGDPALVRSVSRWLRGSMLAHIRPKR